MEERNRLKKYLGINATHVLDPTLLLSTEDYEYLVNAEKEPELRGDLFCYVLDMTKDTRECIATLKASMGYSDYYCMPDYKDTPYNIEKYKHLCVFPPVTQWVRSFMDAKMVFTDSFHGTAFSVIFNKPFYSILLNDGNDSRVVSLLNNIGLSNRLINLNDKVEFSSISYDKVIQKLSILQEKSFKYINESTT